MTAVLLFCLILLLVAVFGGWYNHIQKGKR
jgi:hypothetical protein